jgi:hypothetical protein
MRICAFLIFLFIGLSPVAYTFGKPSIIILTDIGGDTDDEQSMVRFLLYSDMFDIRGFCITSRLGHGQDVRPEIMHNLIDAYGKVYPNLKLHSAGYPDPDLLRSLVKSGQGNQFNFGEGYDTEASDHIIKVVDRAEGVIHIAVWGGLRELAQSLWKVQNTRSPVEVSSFCQKIQVHAIGDQDKHRDWITTRFKDLRFIANGFVFIGNFGIREISSFRGMYMTGDLSMQTGDWVRKNIHGHGPLSDAYQLHGHGTDGMKEGDTPSFLGLIANGLNVPEKPEWGGWGGRFRLLNNSLYIDAQDFLDGTLNERHSVSRWRPAFQHDFMARVKWCTEPFDKANHNPVVVVNGQAGNEPLILETKAGIRLMLDASESSDPDGDHLSFNWFVYHEIYNPANLKIKVSSKGKRCTLNIPKGHSGKSIHLILEVVDSGIPVLTSYKRIIVNSL